MTFSFSFGLSEVMDPSDNLPWDEKEALFTIRDREVEDFLSSRASFRVNRITKTSNSNSVAGASFIEAWTGGGDMQIKAAIGDWIQCSASFGWSNNATVIGRADLWVIPSLRYVSSGSTTGASEGIKCWGGNTSNEATFNQPTGGTFWYQVQSGDVQNQMVTFRVLIASSAASRNIDGNANYPAQFAVVNFGQSQ